MNLEIAERAGIEPATAGVIRLLPVLKTGWDTSPVLSVDLIMQIYEFLPMMKKLKWFYSLQSKAYHFATRMLLIQFHCLIMKKSNMFAALLSGSRKWDTFFLLESCLRQDKLPTTFPCKGVYSAERNESTAPISML